MHLNSILEGIGLSEKESKVYIQLLSLKEALPSQISKKSGVKRPTTYLVLEQLLKKGLVSQVKKGRYVYFQPINPHALLEDQYQRYHNLEKFLPELLSLHKQMSVQPQVSFFQGKEGLMRIMEDTLKASTELLCWADVPLSVRSQSLPTDYFKKQYIPKKIKNKLWLRGIFSYDRPALEYKKRGKEELREVYLISKADFPFKNEINIYDDKVAIISHPDQMGVIIQNQNIADTQRSIFNFAFKYAKLAEKDLLTPEDLAFLQKK